jgi:hypothetical protein
MFSPALGRRKTSRLTSPPLEAGGFTAAFGKNMNVAMENRMVAAVMSFPFFSMAIS